MWCNTPDTFERYILKASLLLPEQCSPSVYRDAHSIPCEYIPGNISLTAGYDISIMLLRRASSRHRSSTGLVFYNSNLVPRYRKTSCLLHIPARNVILSRSYIQNFSYHRTYCDGISSQNIETLCLNETQCFMI